MWAHKSALEQHPLWASYKELPVALKQKVVPVRDLLHLLTKLHPPQCCHLRFARSTR